MLLDLMGHQRKILKWAVEHDLKRAQGRTIAGAPEIQI